MALLNPVVPLAASMVLASVESGTVWPPTNPSATAARKNGHGLLGETAIGWDGARSSCMGLNPGKHRIIGVDYERTQLDPERVRKNLSPASLPQDVSEFGGI